MKKDPKIIRVDDAVKIVKPMIFDRCGYPLCKRDLRPEIQKKYSKQVRDIINTVREGNKGTMSKLNQITDEDRCEAEIIDALTSLSMVAKSFGGSNRSIHVTLKPEYIGVIGRVSMIRFVKTGIRVSSTGGYCSYDGDYEYTPSYLAHEKTHKILYLDFYSMDGYYKGENYVAKAHESIEIEACHVEKIMPKEPPKRKMNDEEVLNELYNMVKSVRK